MLLFHWQYVSLIFLCQFNLQIYKLFSVLQNAKYKLLVFRYFRIVANLKIVYGLSVNRQYYDKTHHDTRSAPRDVHCYMKRLTACL